MLGCIDFSVLLLLQMLEMSGSGYLKVRDGIEDMFLIPFSQENALLSQSDAD